MSSSNSSSNELEQVMARVLQQLERGIPIDEAALKLQYRHLDPELSEFLDSHGKFMSAAQSARDELNDALEQPTRLKIPASTDSAISTAGRLGSLSSTQAVPQRLGPYEIIKEIDRGGMGVVYLAKHVSLDRTVALKLIRSGELASDEEVQRFNIEAAAAAALNHPGIVPIFEVGMLQGFYYYTMAYIDGQPLSKLLKNGPVEKTRALKILHKLCLAVEHAHEHGIYHRDLKPANVLLDAADQPIVIDFGLARVANRNSEITASGQVLGTPAYMAPERAQGRVTPGPSEDIYSLGAIAYYLMAGQPPFSGPTPFDVLLQVLDSEPPRPSQIVKQLDKHHDYLCLKALRKNPAERYLRCSDMAQDVATLLRGEPIDNQRPSVSEWIASWWNREPQLVAHLCGIGATTSILAATFLTIGGDSKMFSYRIALLVVWMAASWMLQRWVRFAHHRDVASLSWFSLDVVIYTWLISFAEPPRSLLLIGYPMMIVASSLFYRRRFVIFTTSCCIVGYLALVTLFPRRVYSGMDIDEQYQHAPIVPLYQGLDIDFFRYEYSAIFIAGLVVISLSLLSVIRRIRRLSLFYGEEP
jgi:eukaryotic-like serine/threonine-protein kinase